MTMSDTSHDLSESLKPEKPKEQKQEDAPKTDRNLFIIIGVILAFVFVLFIGWGIVFPPPTIYSLVEMHELNIQGELDPDLGYMHGGLSFVDYNNRWFTRFMRPGGSKIYDVELRFGPREVSNITLIGDVSSFIKDNTQNATYISFNPLQENLSYVALAAADVTTALNKIFMIAAFPACIQNETDTCSDLPIVKCEDGLPVILIRDAEVPLVVLDGSCIIIEGKNMEIVRAADRLLLEWYGASP